MTSPSEQQEAPGKHPVTEMSMKLPCGLDALRAPVGWPGHSTAAGGHFCTPRVSGYHPVHRQKGLHVGSRGLSQKQERLGEGKLGTLSMATCGQSPLTSRTPYMKKNPSVKYLELTSFATEHT